ncbi:Group 4 capsule polysaccharide lipoprotein gfcB, YjbF [Loktanella sp. DSM 29012]|nr:Group 4 capsule polysaccharide lipoprotein gfcB, YjbF [Loktanella sp. DSM 29012]
MTKMIQILALAACGLTACAPAPYFDLRARVTPAFIASVTTPMVLIELPQKPYAATIVPVAANGPVTTWATPDAITLSMINGVVTATRGMGTDLMHSDIDGTVAALAGGPRAYDRRFSYQNAENQTVLRAQRCTMSGPADQALTLYGTTYVAQMWTETCTGNDQQMPNIYWTAGGRVVQSQQFISAAVGPIITETIRN